MHYTPSPQDGKRKSYVFARRYTVLSVCHFDLNLRRKTKHVLGRRYKYFEQYFERFNH